MRYYIHKESVQKDPIVWEYENSFQIGLEILKKLQNDTAKRALKFMEDYNKTPSRSEEKKQFILQIVSEYRKNTQIV